MKRRADAVDGLLLLDKPSGMTSNRALQTVRRLLNARKAGHTGSLDPAATGMLPLCFGEATKVCAYLLNADKSYRVTAKLGIATNTGDADGKETSTAAVPELSADDWDAILQGFSGESTQIPPMFSALKKNGKRLYELARRGETVERDPRPVRINEIRLLEIAGSRLVFRVSCSKGTYIRVLVEDIARVAGTVAHTARLHRESVGDFAAVDMLDMAVVEDLAAQDIEALRAKLLPPDVALASMQMVSISAAEAANFSAGQSVEVAAAQATGLTRVYGAGRKFIGVGEVTCNGQLAPRRVFQTQDGTP
ncbi:MAG: tRNA pseudouridine(55) synthase TruB [Gammaproteobacteria bacterium]|nr:MAG: tRNA pseudouridine(55) synthase TruB [Gammaproteobacteria bacterium]